MVLTGVAIAVWAVLGASGRHDYITAAGVDVEVQLLRRSTYRSVDSVQDAADALESDGLQVTLLNCRALGALH